MTIAAWFNPFTGIAGDMALGALIDAGADPDAIVDGCRRLGYPGWSLQHAVVERGGLQGVHVRVDVEPQHHHRRAAEIIERIAGAGLAPRAAERAIAVFTRLAAAEGALHGVDPADVHFHEVGAVDSIIDTVGCAVALELLDVDEVHCGPVAVGVGNLTAAHGVLPNPAPAVVRLLEGAAVHGIDVGMELTTPTGAALVAALATDHGHLGAMPRGRLRASGFGAGTRNPPGRPNLLPVALVELIERSGAPMATRPPDGEREGAGDGTGAGALVACLETNLDDVTGEQLGHVVGLLLEHGALDAWCTPIVMKKSRPAVTLSVLSTVEDGERLRELLARETGTLGIRRRLVQRWVAPRSSATVTVDGEPVRIKIGPHGAKPEHDDVVRAAAALGCSWRDIELAVRSAQAAGTTTTSIAPASSAGTGREK